MGSVLPEWSLMGTYGDQDDIYIQVRSQLPYNYGAVQGWGLLKLNFLISTLEFFYVVKKYS